ncbi:MAG: serine hydrolase [Longimicrobiales bacterium]
MRRLTFVLVPVLLAGACSTATRTAAPARVHTPELSTGLAPLEAAIRARLANEPGEFGIAVIDLETGRRVGVNEELVMHAASTMKVPVLLELYRRAAEGSIDLDGAMTVRTRFQSIVDTSHYELSAGGDSEADLYARAGSRVTLRELARRMIVRSSNLATNLLIDTLKAPTVMATLSRIDGLGMTVRRGVEDSPAFAAGLNNTTNARGLANVFASIARCDILPRTQCDEVVRVLADQEFNDMLPTGMPTGTRIAHKTGWITGIQHDGGIVFPDGSPPFVVVVLTRGAKDTTAAKIVARDVARLTWDALGPAGSMRPHWPAAIREIADLYDRHHYAGTFPDAGVKHAELWNALRPVIDRSSLIEDQEIATSAQGRSIRAVSFGTGTTPVLLWSQMHGDEPTATRALADLLHFVASAPDDRRVTTWASKLSVHMIPMLNPDGAEVTQRRDAFGVDVNRDARTLRTPEGRALKSAQERFRPVYGFNLHDQNPRTRVERAEALAAIALLAPPPDSQGTLTPGYDRALRLASFLGRRIEPMVQGHLTRYDDTFNPRAFGDLMEAWGVSTVLIESGAWHNDPAKSYLRKVNFVLLVSALDAIASGEHMRESAEFYARMPENGLTINGLLVRGGTVVLPGMTPARVDIAINEKSVGGTDATEIVDIGDLDDLVARDTINATGLFIHVDAGVLAASGGLLRNGDFPRFTIRRTADPASATVWIIDGIRVRRME